MNKDEALKGAIGAEYQKSPWDGKGISMPPPEAQQEPYKGLSDHLVQTTNGRVYVDPVTGDVGIGTPAAPVQEPMEVDQATMELAESVGLIGPASRTHDLHCAIQRFHDLICVNATIKAAKMAADAIRESTPPAAKRPDIDRLVALARADEREACAKVCEDMAKGYEERNARPEENRDINPEVAWIASMTCAFVEDAIRARGNT
jgi:hypothetical protein